MTEVLHRVADAEEGLALEAGLFEAAAPCACLWRAASPALACPAAYRRRHRRGGRTWLAGHHPSNGWWHRFVGHGCVEPRRAKTVGTGVTIEDGYRLGVSMETGATPDSFCDGAWNLSIRGRKLVGTAQRWRPLRGGRARILAHALILTDGRIAAQAVDAFHRDLGLGHVRAEVHTTLEAELGQSMPSIAALAEALKTAATRGVAEANSTASQSLTA